jgi:hypothetical protein
MTRELLRTDEAALFLDLAKSTLEAWRHRGGGPPYLKYGKAVRYRVRDLETFQSSCLRQNTSQPTTK